MIEWHFYDLTTGLFRRQRLASSDPALVEANTPPGCGAYAGAVDPESQRIDLATGALVDWQPDQPSSEHEWDPAARRWELTRDAAKREARRIDAEREIERLERQQLRAMREVALDGGNEDAKTRLRAIDDEIAALRPALQTTNNKGDRHGR